MAKYFSIYICVFLISLCCTVNKNDIKNKYSKKNKQLVLDRDIYDITSSKVCILSTLIFIIFFNFFNVSNYNYGLEYYNEYDYSSKNRNYFNFTISDNAVCKCNNDYLTDKYTGKHRKIFVIGLPKAGTTSLHSLFSCMGYNSVHWKTRKGFVGKLIYKAKNKSLPLLYYLKEFDAFAQMDYFYRNYTYIPQIDLFMQLDAEYPNSFFILNYRNLTNHYRSMKNYRDIIKILNYLNLTNLPSGYGSDLTDFSNWLIRHYYKAEKYFKNNDEKRFLLLDIESKKAKNNLKEFFQCETLVWTQDNISKKNK